MPSVPTSLEELLQQNAIGLSRAQIAAKCKAYKISGWLGQLKALKDAGRIKTCGMFWNIKFKLVPAAK